MKILIVNGYSNNNNGQKRFADFVQVIKDVSRILHLSFLGFPKTKVIHDITPGDSHQGQV